MSKTAAQIATELEAEFGEKDLKHRPGRAGMTFTYVDARAVAQRLTEVLTIGGWQFKTKPLDLVRGVVRGKLKILVEGVWLTHEDAGYPNSTQDDEPLKSAASDALRRCAAQVGVGRSLYSPEKGVPVPLGRVAPRSVAPTPLSVDSGEALTDDQTIALKAAMVFSEFAGGETCSHGTEWVLKPGGVSKVSNKPYGPFYTASHKTADGGWCKDKPSREFLASHPTEEPKPKMVPEDLSELPF